MGWNGGAMTWEVRDNSKYFLVSGGSDGGVF